MKRIWIAVALLAAISVLCVLSASATARCVEELSRPLLQARDAARRGSYAEAADFARAAQESWQSHDDLLGALLRHDEADCVETDLAALIEYCDAEKQDEICAHCAELLRQAEHLRQMELPLLKNIL